jgi:hypothetical protein
VCVAGNDPDITGPEACETTYASRSSSYCEVQDRCVRSVEVTDNVDATLVRNRYASCSSNGGSALYCSCNDGRQYEVEGQDGSLACDTIMDVCDDPNLEFDGPVTCVSDYQRAGVGYCESQQRCRQTLEFEGAVIAVTNEYRNASCSPRPEGGSTCGCSSSTSSIQFDTDLSTDDLATCEQFAEECGTTKDLGLNGPITCERVSQTANVQYCDATIACKQAGMLGDTEVQVYGYLNTYCQPLGDAWSCNCTTNNGSQSSSISLEAEDGWDACTIAAERCPDEIDVVIGEQNFGVLPPGRPAF